ncbi:hypothetical protein GCM10027048_36730 [Hymenobacter coalescens]
MSLNVKPAAVASDATGNSYVIGGFAGTAQVGNTTLTSNPLYAGDTDAFLAKFSPTGALLWVTQFGGPYASVRPKAIAVDPGGNCYFTGTVRGTVTYGAGQTLTGVMEWPGVLVGRCNATGQISWLRRDGSSGYASIGGSGIAADAAGNCYVAGAATTPFAANTSQTALRYQVFIASYSVTGALRWADVGQSPTMFNNAFSLALDGQGSGYVTGSYTERLTLAGTTLTAPGVRGFVGRFRQQDGALNWLQNLDSNVGHVSMAAADGQGLVVAGQYSRNTTFEGKPLSHRGGDDAFLAHFTKAGRLRWVRPLPATAGDDVPVAVRCDGYGGSFVLLNQSDAQRGSGTTINNLTLVSSDLAGQPRWVTTVAGTPAVSGAGFALDAGLRACVVGSFNSTCQFGPYTLTGGSDTGFVARLHGTAPDEGRAVAALAPATVDVFPNPAAAGRCTVRIPDATPQHPVQLSLLDRFGKVVLEQKLTAAESNLLMHGLAPGPYTLRLIAAEHSSSRQLLINP